MACPEKEGNEICGQPQYSTSSPLCAEHFSDKYPVTFRRLETKSGTDEKTHYLENYGEIQNGNKNHGIEQMKFAWALMWKLRGVLGGESKMPGWFKYVYGENPNYGQAWAEIELDQWKKDTGIYKSVDEVLAKKEPKIDYETGEVLEPIINRGYEPDGSAKF